MCSFSWKCRSSRPEIFCKKGVLKNFAKFTGKHLCQSFFFNKETMAQVFSWESCEISKSVFFTEHLWWLLLKVICNQFWRSFNLTKLESLDTNLAKLESLDTNLTKLESLDTNVTKLESLDTNLTNHQRSFHILAKYFSKILR